MEKEIYITLQKSGNNYPSAYESKGEALKYFNQDTQYILKGTFKLPFDIESESELLEDN